MYQRKDAGRGAHNLSHSNSALRQHSIEQAALSGGKHVDKQIDKTPVMTPVQQKYGQAMFHSAAINNYLTSGARIIEQTPKQQTVSNSATVHQKGARAVKNQSQQHLQQNQFNRASLKKSDMKQLQKFCEQNGLDFNAAAYDRQILTQATTQQVPVQQQQQLQQSKSLSKERKFINAQNISSNAQAYFPGAGVGTQPSAKHHNTGNQNSSQSNQRANKHNSSHQQQQHQPSQVQFSSHAQQYGLYQSSPTALLDNSPVKNQNMANQVSQLQMVNFAMPANSVLQNSSSQFTLAASQSKSTIASQRSNSGPTASTATQAKRASDWKKPQMMPSQMSINEAKNMAPVQSQEATAQLANMFVNQKSYHHLDGSTNANISTASQGYLSQKASPLGRLSVERPHNPLNENFKGQKLARYPFYSGKGGNNQQAKGSQQHTGNQATQSNSRKSSKDNNDLSNSYLNQKSIHLGTGQANQNSASCLDTKFVGQNRQIDSGAGVIALNNSVVVSGTGPRKDTYNQQQRGIQVEMKSALQSRRKHGSIETYKQNGTNWADSNSNGQVIRQGQGEIVPQRALQSNKSSVYAKNLGISASSSQQQQLPNVVRNSTHNSSVKTNASSGLPVQGGVSRPQQERMAVNSQQSTSLLNQSTPMISSSGQKPQARMSPSDERRYQASNQSNAIRQSGLSRGSIKQNSQHALSGSNHMNVSLSQTSSRGLPKSHKDSSVEQLHERRIAYEASQGKLGAANPQRHARIRTNNNSLDRDSAGQGYNYQIQEKGDKAVDLKFKGQKRGAITVAKNSPRQVIQQVKGVKQRISDGQSRGDYERYQPSSNPQTQVTSNPVGDDSYRLITNNQRAGDITGGGAIPSASHTPPIKDYMPNNNEFEHQQQTAQGLRQQTPAYTDANGQPVLDVEYLAYLQQQQQQQQDSQGRYDDGTQQHHLQLQLQQQQNSIEQYSRRLQQTPNTILDGGTGSGGAVTTLQHQTKQLLKEQQQMLEKLGYKSQISNPTNDKQSRHHAASSSKSHVNNQQAIKNSSQGFNLKGQSQIHGIEQHHHNHPPANNNSSKVNLKSSQRSLASTKPINGQKQSSTEGKKTTLLGHKVHSQKKETAVKLQSGEGSTNKVLNLGHAAPAQPKQVATKTSAQTSNTAFTVKVNNPQYVQYSVNAKQQAIIAPTVGQNMHKNASLKLKKSTGVTQPANLIMYQQQIGKRSNSQELINNPVNEAQLKVILRPNQYSNNTSNDPKNTRPKPLKGEKRASSQPTVIAPDQEISMQQQQAAGNYFHKNAVNQNQNLPKYYNKQLQYQNRRLSDDPTSRQGLNSGIRSSQRSTSNPNSSSQPIGSKAKQHQYVKPHQQPYQPAQGVIMNKELAAHQIEQQEREEKRRAEIDNLHNRSKRLRKQTSVPQLAIQRPAVDSQNVPEPSAEAGGGLHNRKSKSSGPGRPQYSVNQPNVVAVPETLITDYEKDRRLITEDDEHEIRQVASDINEKAFYGKIIRTKKALQNEGEFCKLSPRSQEIGYVMQKLQRAFAMTDLPPTTDITFYRIGKMLGRGAFGKVNLAMHKLVRKLVALKSLNKSALTDEVQKAKQMKEVNLLQKLRHNHVVKIYETIETQKHIIIVMELCAGGDLLNYVRKRRRLKEPFAQKIFKQIVDGLSYIHSKNIAHRDIKLDNILLDGKGNVKIADFGVSRQVQPDQIMREQCGTPAYIAPEILRNRGYSLNVDTWSAGVVLFAMLYGTVPFKAQTMDELHQLILKGKYLLKEDISIEARDLLRGLLEINPKKRLSIRKIYRHPWLRGMDTSVQLFNDEERKMIKKEYTYNDGSRYNRNIDEEPVDCFTLHHLESQYSTLKNQDSKSIILAPFNSTMSEQSDTVISEARNKVMEQMEIKQQVLRFSKKCREIDRQYEFNNNGQLDNGVYHKVVANNSFEQQDKYEETQGIEIEQSLIDSFKERAKRQKNSSANARNDNVLTASEPSSFLSMAETQYQIQNNLNKPIDPIKVQKLVQFGYPERYVLEQMRDMVPNYCTAGYYLLEMDQNYC